MHDRMAGLKNGDHECKAGMWKRILIKLEHL
jgi:hypothetical protein